jgi:exodeoxyribonuclease VII small subunit
VIDEKELVELLSLSHEQIQKLDYETAEQKLQRVVLILEQGDASIESSFKLYAVGTNLNKRCAAILDETEEKMLQLMGTIENPAEAPFIPEKDGK